MNIVIKKIITTSMLILFTSFYVQAGGISVDAGLTPGQDRWILRTQYRFMKMQNSNMTAQNHIFPLIVAYGVTSNFTLIARGMYVNRIIEMDHEVQKRGFNDPFILLKIKVYRKNTAHYVMGIAPYFASNVPVGSKEISDNTWNPEVGLSMSLRPRFWALDFTSSYTVSDALKKTEVQESDNLSLNLAFSSIIPIKNSNTAISPVLELTYNKEFNSNVNERTKQEILYLSPGLTFIKSSLMLEALYQIAVLQRTDAQIMKSKSRFVTGLRYMF
jgi:hypothetical protein